MTPEELLRPRYKVIADYPKSIYQVGEIRNVGINGDLLYCDWDGPRMSDYPHLFRKLEWWEDRKIEDMPEYVKHAPSGNVYELRQDNVQWIFAYRPEQFQPATEAEYLEYASK